jgi:Zn-dependent peptidase ImmA (M78 family)
MKWLSIRVGGQKWGVYLVKGNSRHFGTDENEEVDGVTYVDRCRIYVSSSLEPPVRDDTLLHELLHASFHVSGAQHALHEAVGGDAEKTDALEERVIRCLTPVLHRLLVDLGFRFPKGPNE